MTKTNIYIDGNNLFRAIQSLGLDIDYVKFRTWLSQKFNADNIYVFLGSLETNLDMYDYLSSCGFQIIFKETLPIKGVIKGNCDVELALKVLSDFYIQKFDLCVLISGDGDFVCLIDFLIENNKLRAVVAPDLDSCSTLIKRRKMSLIFLNTHYQKLLRA